MEGEREGLVLLGGGAPESALTSVQSHGHHHPQLRCALWHPPRARWGWQGVVPQFPGRSLPQACSVQSGGQVPCGELGQHHVLTPPLTRAACQPALGDCPGHGEEEQSFSRHHGAQRT